MKKNIALILAAALVLPTVIAAGGCGANSGVSSSAEATAENPMVLTLAHGLSETHTVHIAMTQFADEVKEKTDGRIIINIFPNGQLGSETENLEQLQAGVIAMIPKTSTTLWILRTCRISSFPPRKTDL